MINGKETKVGTVEGHSHLRNESSLLIRSPLSACQH
jgi:hypothetical protein